MVEIVECIPLYMINQPLPFGRSKNAPKKIIVHSMGEFIDVGEEDVFAIEFLRRLKLSAHIFVDPFGRVFRSREDTQGAFHAREYNPNSLGIEFLVPGSHTYGSFLEAIKEDWVAPEQLDSGIQVVREWMGLWDIDKGNILRHADVAPGRKHDPGDGFPWNEFLARL